MYVIFRLLLVYRYLLSVIGIVLGFGERKLDKMGCCLLFYGKGRVGGDSLGWVVVLGKRLV